MDAYSVSPLHLGCKSRRQSVIGVLTFAHGTNATGTPSVARSSVATSGQTEPPAPRSLLMVSTWPSAESTGSCSSCH